jgi:hypothetical protein
MRWSLAVTYVVAGALAFFGCRLDPGSDAGLDGSAETADARIDASADARTDASRPTAADSGSATDDDGGDPADDGGADQGAADAAVAFLPKPLARTVELAANQDHPTGIAVWGSRVYWANEGAGTIVSCEVDACTKRDRTTHALALRYPHALAVDASGLYWLETGGDSFAELEVKHCPLDGCDGKPRTLFYSGYSFGAGLAVSDEYLFIGTTDVLLRCPKAGCVATAATIAAGGLIAGVAADATHVYFVRSDSRRLYRCPHAGCGNGDAQATELASDRFPWGIASDGSSVYWTNHDYFRQHASSELPAIQTCPASGCTSAEPPLAALEDEIAPWAIALDAVSYFWTDYETGAITRSPRPAGH